MKTGDVKIFLILLTLSLGLLITDKQNLLGPIRTITSVVAMPVQYGLYSIKHGVGETFSFLTFWKSGEARIKNLEQRNLELVSYEQKAKDLDKENQILRKQIGAKDQAIRQLFPATVLFSGSYLEIAGGTRDGVKEGQTVVIYDHYVGRITRANVSTSLVQLPTDATAKIPVKTNSAHGLIVGLFNSSMSLEKVAQNEQINVDDTVLTSGEGGIVPNLIVGRIGTIKKAQSDLFQTATVVPILNYIELSTVFVITAD